MRIPLTLASAAAVLSVALPAFAAETTFSTKPFTDVPESSPYHDAIEYLRQKNVLKGYEDGSFHPNSRINRAEFVKLITNPYVMSVDRLNQCMQQYDGTTGEKVFFKDVPKDAWYAAEVCYAKDRSIISGYLDGTFRPSDPTNFVETAKILTRVFSLQVNTELTPWYKPYVDRLSELHAIPTTVRSLNAYITRGEMAEILYRLRTKTTNKDSKTSGELY
jgi:hypothetical protein